MPEDLSGLPAELLVASKMAQGGWNIYSPHRDIGFDFIATKQLRGRIFIRPVQVKGCYYRARADSPCYGKRDMEITQIHDQMILVIPYFVPTNGIYRLLFTAYMPHGQLRVKPNGRYRSEPAMIQNGEPRQRRDFRKFFDHDGLRLTEAEDFPVQQPESRE